MIACRYLKNLKQSSHKYPQGLLNKMTPKEKCKRGTTYLVNIMLKIVVENLGTIFKFHFQY